LVGQLTGDVSSDESSRARYQYRLCCSHCAENLQLKIRDLEHADKTSIGCPLRASSPRGITDNTARLSVMQLMSALGG